MKIKYTSDGSDKPIRFNLQTSLESADLDKISQTFLDRMKANPIFTNEERDFKASTPTLDIIVNREKTYRYGVDIDTISKTIQYIIAGRQVGDFRLGNDIYEVMIHYEIKDCNDSADLKKIYINSDTSNLLPIETLAKIIDTLTVEEYQHHNNSRSITITSDMAPDSNLGDAVKIIEDIAKDVINTDNTQLKFRGQINQIHESTGQTIIIF